MTDSERIAKLEAQVLAQQALLTAFAYKLINTEPLSRSAHNALLGYTKQPGADFNQSVAARTVLDNILSSWPKNL